MARAARAGRGGAPGARGHRCAECNTWLWLRHAEYGRDVDGIAVEGDVPILMCPKCGAATVPAHVEGVVRAAARRARDAGRGRCLPAFGQQRFDLCEVEFVYDSSDWLVIPMLRQSDSERDGYYTPVFFKRAVLLKYMVRDEYTTRQFRDGGSIHFANGSDLMYGINRSGLVVCWLGELDRIPPEEQHYMLSENTGSDHDVVSGLYSQSRLGEPEGETDEQLLVGEVSRLAAAVREKRGFDLYEFRAAEIQIMQRLARPVVWNDSLVSTMTGLVKVCIESLRAGSLREACGADPPAPPCERCGAVQGGGPVANLLLLEKWLGVVFGSSKHDVTDPLRVLQTWRNILAHRSDEDPNKRLYWCYRAMGIHTDQTPERLYDTMIRRLLESYKDMVTTIELEIPKIERGDPDAPPA